MMWTKILALGACTTLLIAACAGRSPVGSTPGGGDADGGLPLDMAGPADGPAALDQGPTVPGAFKLISKGTFIMGSAKSENCRVDNETRHNVKLSFNFQIMVTEVTQSMFKQVLGYNPSKFTACGGNCPADSITWSTAVYYANSLSKQMGLDTCYLCDSKNGLVTKPYNCRVNPAYATSKPGKTIYDCPGYRLPTEAEWEYAYRARTKTATYHGNLTACHADGKGDAIGWYHNNANKKTHPVRQKMANAWGLYDMGGNAWEWVNDWYRADLGGALTTNPVGPSTGNGKVLKGGSYTVSVGGLRGAARGEAPIALDQSFLGFRIARTMTK